MVWCSGPGGDYSAIKLPWSKTHLHVDSCVFFITRRSDEIYALFCVAAGGGERIVNEQQEFRRSQKKQTMVSRHNSELLLQSYFRTKQVFIFAD